MTTADRYSTDANGATPSRRSSGGLLHKPTAVVAMLGLLTTLGLGASRIAGHDDSERMPKRFSATSPSLTPKTGDEIARIRSSLDDPKAMSVAIGELKDARVFPLNAEMPDQTHEEWLALERWIAATCVQAQSKGWVLQLTATTDSSGSKQFNTDLAARRAAAVADLVDEASCWNRDQIADVPLPASTEGGPADQAQRRVTATYIRPPVN